MLSLEKIYMYNCQRADSVSLEYDNLSGSYIYPRWDTCISTRLNAELSIYCCFFQFQGGTIEHFHHVI